MPSKCNKCDLDLDTYLQFTSQFHDLFCHTFCYWDFSIAAGNMTLKGTGQVTALYICCTTVKFMAFYNAALSNFHVGF